MKWRDALLALMIIAAGLIITASRGPRVKGRDEMVRGLEEFLDRLSTGESEPGLRETEVPRAGELIDVDGDLSDWWAMEPIILIGDEPCLSPADFSTTGYLAWDEDYFYLASRVGDDVFDQRHHGGEISRGDSIQFVVCPPPDAGHVHNAHGEYRHEYGVALSGGRVETWRWEGAPAKAGPVLDLRAAVTRRDRRTCYEIAVPWSLLPPLRGESGRAFGLSLLFNDNDGSGRKCHGWGGDIAPDKTRRPFERLVLVL